MYQIEFRPTKLKARIGTDETILEAARSAGLDIESICGGHGTCRQCRVQVIRGSVSAVTSDEHKAFSPQELKSGYRLACQTRPFSHCIINIPSESLATEQRAQSDGLETPVDLDPPVREFRLTLPESLGSVTDIQKEVLIKILFQQQGIKCKTIDDEALQSIKSKEIPSKSAIRASVRGNEIISLRSWPGKGLGLAFDLGTTKIAGYLLDMDSGRTIAAQGIPNPQASYGDDVITRLVYARDSSYGAIKIQQLAIDALNKLAASMCRKTSGNLDDIIETVVVGNTAMHHLALKLPVARLLQPPFSPFITDAMDIKARNLGLRFAPGSYVHFLPNVAGFVGADHVAMLLASGITQTDGTALAIDIGTNTEISLLTGPKILCVSCASGPAFEGGHIKHGMKAATGAIDRLQLLDNTVQYHTIGGAPAIGLCGSAIIDAVSQLYLAGVLDTGGRMKDHPLVRVENGQREFVVVSEEESGKHKEITITQRDVRELQLAKAAVRTGIEVLLRSKGITIKNIEQVIVAGAFGSYLDLASAITIGMFPSLPLERFSQVGNAAGTGARMALISTRKRLEAQELARRIQYIELSSTPDFDKIYTSATRIEPMAWSD
jgi:uncharacterized 2Fe-2S/4Fe-4S cluster protein (DUF4445 family)